MVKFSVYLNRLVLVMEKLFAYDIVAPNKFHTKLAEWTTFSEEIDHKIFSTVILSLLLIKEGQCQFLAKECAQY